MKKYAPYILILIILVGLFSPMIQVQAADPAGPCTRNFPSGSGLSPKTLPGETQAQCQADLNSSIAGTTASWQGPTGGALSLTQGTGGTAAPGQVNNDNDIGTCTLPDASVKTGWTRLSCTQNGGTSFVVTTAGTPATTTPTGTPSEFQKYIDSKGCGLGITDHSSLYPGCLIALTYGLFYVIPSWLLWFSAYFFNVLISITLYSKIFANSVFITTAWGVVRDLSNIFFILILLYIAVRLILGLGGSEAKKTIAKVVIIALLINFSMFFTEIIVDTSNIIALVFYNKLNVDTKNADGSPRPYDAVSGEKIDVAGGMVNSFDATKLVGADFFTLAKKHPPINGVAQPDDVDVAPGILIGMTIIAGALMFFAAYCFFVAGISFVGRMIELFVLIIFSPFAFMSSSIPILNDVKYLGWKDWFSRLLTTSFMAPIFMFFLYFIFLLIATKPSFFDNLVDKSKQSLAETILLVVIPALIILILLLKATEFAKKGSGKFGEVVMTGAKVVGGLAIGAATGGAALLGSASLGRAGAAIANSERAKRWETEGKFGAGALRNVGKTFGSASYDVRGVKIGGKTLAGATGLELGEARKGGFTERRKEQVEKRKNRMKELEVGEDEPLKQQVRIQENALDAAKSDPARQANITTFTKDIADAEKLLATSERALKDAIDRFGGNSTQADFARINRNSYVAQVDTAKGNLKTAEQPIKNAEAALKVSQNDVIAENRTRRVNYSNVVQNNFLPKLAFLNAGGQAAQNEAANKIRADIQAEKK